MSGNPLKPLLRTIYGQLIPYAEKCIHLGNTVSSNSTERSLIDSAITEFNIKQTIYILNFHLANLLHCLDYLVYISQY